MSKRTNEDLKILQELQKEVSKLYVEIAKLQSLETNVSDLKKMVASINDKIETLRKDIAEEQKEQNEKNEETFVSNDTFNPVKILVYGFAGLIFTAVVLALTGLVIK